MSGYILLIQMDVPAELEDNFNRYYNTQHVPNLLQVDGVHSCTQIPGWRLHRMKGWRDMPPCMRWTSRIYTIRRSGGGRRTSSASG